MQTTQLVFPSGLVAKAIVDVIGLLSIPLQGLGLDSDPAILATFCSHFGDNCPNFLRIFVQWCHLNCDDHTRQYGEGKCCGDMTRL